MRKSILKKHHLQVVTPGVAMSVLKFELRGPHSCVVWTVKFFGWPQFFADESFKIPTVEMMVGTRFEFGRHDSRSM